ncbi:hypothetical protein ACFVU9_23700, partial [Kitasatospora sp. NPDC057936]
MNGDACEGGSGAGPVVAGAWWTDLGLLVNGDPARVWGLLDSGAGREARLVAAVYRASAHVHRYETAGVRRQLLALDAARYGDMELAARIGAVPVVGEPAPRWQVEWSTGSQVDARARQVMTSNDPGFGGGVCAVATAVVDGRPVALEICEGDEVHVWDLITGDQIGDPLIDHDGVVYAVATTVVDGRSVAVTGGNAVQVWDLATGEQVGEPLRGHDGVVRAVATGAVEGRPVAVTVGDDETVRVWDLATGEQTSALLHGHDGVVRAVATAVVEGRPVAVTGGADETVRVWDLATG